MKSEICTTATYVNVLETVLAITTVGSVFLLICCQYRLSSTELHKKDLKKPFLSSLDAHSAHLMKLYRARSGATGEDIKRLLEKLDEKVINNCKRLNLLEKFCALPSA